MKKISEIKRKMIRYFCTGICLTSAAFVFQACYGPMIDGYDNVVLTGKVTSKSTKSPIMGIQVSVNDEEYLHSFTDKDGNFVFFASFPTSNHSSKNNISVHFRDIDGIENGWFTDKTLFIDPTNQNEVIMNVELEEKQ